MQLSPSMEALPATKVKWHKFADEQPEYGREVFITGLGWEVIIVEDLEDGSGWSNEYQMEYTMLEDQDDPLTHWAYFERPDPPENLRPDGELKRCIMQRA